MNISYRGKFYVYVGAALCCVGGLVFLSWYVFGMITTADTRILDAKRELVSLTMKQNAVGAITKDYETVRDLLPALDDMLLARDEKLQFIMLVENLASQAGVFHVIEAADDAKPGKNETSTPATLAFNITIFGSYPNVLRFIYLLESQKIYLSIDRAQIGRGGAPTNIIKPGVMAGKDDVKAQLSVKVYAR